MKIAIDISQVVYGTGVSTYTRNLVKNLLVIDQNEYILFGSTLRRRDELDAFLGTLHGLNFESKIFPIPPTLASYVWNRLHILPVERLIGEVDVFHSSDWIQPPTRAFNVTTIHDLIPLKFPELSHPRIVSTHKERLKWVTREVDAVIVPSKTTAKDAVSLGIKEDKIRVIPEAPDPIFAPVKKDEIKRVKKRYGIYGKYLLAIGITPRKNTERIIEAFETFKVDTRMNLVVVGHPFGKFKAKRGVLFLKHVQFRELPAFYSGADALVYPSLYEGFGLPILEAYACKTPVITSNLGSMKEIAGNAAVLVDPYDVDSIVEGIKKALRAKSLGRKGVKRVKNFSWQKTASETLKIYKERD